MHTVSAGGFEIAYERAGHGPSLLLLHGALGDRREWRPQLEDLSADYDVVAWDAPGCGGSSDPPESVGLHGYADCLAEFTGALGLERPHVLGLSFGGGLALELYRRHPAIPASLLLVSAYAGWAGSLPAAVVRERLEWALEESKRPPEEFVRDFLPGLFTESAPPDLVEEATAVMLEFRPLGVRAMGRAFAEADLRDVLPRVAVPTLLLYGDRDVRSPLDVAHDLHARIPTSELVVIEGAGHLLNLESVERFNAEVRGFLETAAGGAR